MKIPAAFALLLLPFRLILAADDPAVVEDINRQLADFQKIPSEVTRSPADRAKAEAIVNHLDSLPRPLVYRTVLDAVVRAKTEREIVRYRAMLPHLDPVFRDELLVRLRAEPNPVGKANVLVCLQRFNGAAVVRALVEQFADKRAAEPNASAWPQALRVCDYAFIALYAICSRTPELGLTGIGSPIVHDTSVQLREDRLQHAKAALIAKYGPELKIEDQK